MILNYIWIAFFLIAFVVALVRLIFFHDLEAFSQLVRAIIDSSKTGFDISIGLVGVLSFWLGIMKIGEKGGMINLVSKAVAPFFNRLFPSLPKNHPVFGTMTMNLSANMLGLDNAATPMGLKAMTELQELNPSKEEASNAQIMFMVLNAAGLTLIPVSIMVYRAQMGAVNPADVFIPILLSTFFATLAGIFSVAFFQKINLLNKVIITYLGGFSLLVGLAIWYLSGLTQDEIKNISMITANVTLFTIITAFITRALIQRVNVYESFIEGAKEGFTVAVKIIPYLIAILVGVGVFRASGAMGFLIQGIASIFALLGVNTAFVDVLPVAIMKPFSGSGARGMMIDVMKTNGADSFVGRLACTVQGAADTTFYIIALYFGSVGIRKTRHALICGLIADFAGITAAILLGYLFWG